MKNAPKITAKNIANIETTTLTALQVLEESDARAQGTRSDVYALFAVAVLTVTGNIAGDRKGTEVRKQIAEIANQAGYKFAKGSLSKAEKVLAELVVAHHGEQDNYTAEQYAEAYEALVAEGGNIFSAYDEQNGEDGDGDGKKNWSLEQAVATLIAKARKEEIADEAIIAEVARQIAGN